MTHDPQCPECSRLLIAYAETTHAVFRLDGKVKMARLRRENIDGVAALEAEYRHAVEERERAREEMVRHQRDTHGRADFTTA